MQPENYSAMVLKTQAKLLRNIFTMQIIISTTNSLSDPTAEDSTFKNKQQQRQA